MSRETTATSERYFSRAVLRLSAVRDATFQELTRNGYLAHELVWTLFGDHEDRDRDFIYRWDEFGTRRVLRAISARRPVDREGLFEIDTKPYSPAIRTGQRLDFSLRANPIVKKWQDGRQRAHDVVMNAKWEMKHDERDTTWEEFKAEHERVQAGLVRQEGLKWLERQGEENHGFSFDEREITTEAYEKHSFRKSGNDRRVTFCTIDYRGRLRVEEPEAFTEMLFEGIGSSKAFGCGMMMVKPPE